MPLELPAGASARYVDIAPADELRAQNPELAASQLVDVDLIDDGESLALVADASVDFVVANHFIEHCEDPLGTLRNLLRVTHPGGCLFMAVPDRTRSFDRDRPPTPWDHLRSDYREGPAGSRGAHYEEWVRLVEGVDEQWVHARAARAQEVGQRIHFHTWTRAEFQRLLQACADEMAFPLKIEAVVPNLSEFVAVVRRTDAQLPAAPDSRA